jgi:hypothetical protein
MTLEAASPAETCSQVVTPVTLKELNARNATISFTAFSIQAPTRTAFGDASPVQVGTKDASHAAVPDANSAKPGSGKNGSDQVAQKLG